LDNKKNPSTVFNRILTLLKLGEKDKALDLIKNLTEDNLKIYKDLNDNNDYAMDISEYISLSVIDDKSKYYWNNYYRYWIENEEYLNFLKENIQNTDNIIKTQINPLDSFKNYLIEQDLKELTIKGHLDNLELFIPLINNFESVEEKLDKLSESLAKTTLGKYITSLNKFYSFSLKEESKDIKTKLKELKLKYNL